MNMPNKIGIELHLRLVMDYDALYLGQSDIAQQIQTGMDFML